MTFVDVKLKARTYSTIKGHENVEVDTLNLSPLCLGTGKRLFYLSLSVISIFLLKHEVS